MDILRISGLEYVRDMMVAGSEATKKKIQAMKITVPESRPLPLKYGTLMFGGTVVLGTMISTAIGGYVFFGTLSLMAFIALVESSKYLKWAVQKSSKLIDFALFGGALWATASLGVTISAALTVAGLGYTLVYAPFVRMRAERKYIVNDNKKSWYEFQ